MRGNPRPVSKSIVDQGLQIYANNYWYHLTEVPLKSVLAPLQCLDHDDAIKSWLWEYFSENVPMSVDLWQNLTGLPKFIRKKDPEQLPLADFVELCLGGWRVEHLPGPKRPEFGDSMENYVLTSASQLMGLSSRCLKHFLSLGRQSPPLSEVIAEENQLVLVLKNHKNHVNFFEIDVKFEALVSLLCQGLKVKDSLAMSNLDDRTAEGVSSLFQALATGFESSGV